MKCWLSAIILLALFNTAEAQLSDTTRYYFEYAGTGIINNTEISHSYIFRNAVGADFKIGDWYLNNDLSFIYGKANHLKTNKDIQGVIDLNYKKKSTEYVIWVLATYDKSYSLKINKRLQYGGGLSYNILNKNNNRINISDGILREESNLLMKTGENDIYQTWRNSLRLKYSFHIKEVFTISGMHFIQHSFSEKSDYNIRSQSELSLRLYKWVSFTTSVIFNKINRLQTENFLLTVGLSARKSFR